MADPMRSGLIIILFATLLWGSWEAIRDNQQLPKQHSISANDQFTFDKPVENQRPISDYLAIIERPLFFTQRRLPKIQQENPQEDQPRIQQTVGLSEIQMNAIILQNGQPSALIQLPGNDKYRRVHEGDIVNGWRLQKINESSITLMAGQQQHVIKLHDFTQAINQPPIPPYMRQAQPLQ